MSWWSEGLFIAAILPPLVPIWLGADWAVASTLSLLGIAAILATGFAAALNPDRKLRGRFYAITLGTALGNLVLIGWCLLN
jgi:hypothetical protein